MSEEPLPSERVKQAAEAILDRVGHATRIGVVLGSGLGHFGDVVQEAVRIPFERIEGMPVARVSGHAGVFVLGRIGRTEVAVMQGRLHAYEGHPLEEVVFGVRLLRALGAETVLLTNASGGIDPAIAPGELMAITDHLNLTGRNPLVGPNDPALGPRFPDMSEVYDAASRRRLHDAAASIGIAIHEGVYAGVLGPSYETPAEIRMLAAHGASAVGMSTVHEAIAARHVGMRVAGLSCITNRAAGLSLEKLNHEEVKATAGAAAEAVAKLIEAFVEERK
jgi:purine-nucleoside phosphorylase